MTPASGAGWAWARLAWDGVEEAIAAILAAARATGKVAGIQVFNTRAAGPRIEQGFRFVSVMSEFEMVRDTAAEVLRAVNYLGAKRGIENLHGTTS